MRAFDCGACYKRGMTERVKGGIGISEELYEMKRVDYEIANG